MQTLPEISELHGVAGLGLVLGVLPLLVLILLVRLLFGIDVLAPMLHQYGIRIRRYGYDDTAIRHLQKIRIRRYGEYI